MKSLHRPCHLGGTGASVFGKPLPSSSSSTMLLAHKIGWKHYQEPADSARLQEFNRAVRRSSGDIASADSHGAGDREREAVVSSSVVPVAPEETGEVVSGGGVPAADLPSDRMASNGAGEGLEENATSVLVRVPTTSETEEVGSASSAMASDEAIFSSPTPATAPPPDDDIWDKVEGSDRANEAHRQRPAPASGKVVWAGYQDDGPSSPNPSRKQIRLTSSCTKPAETSAPSSGNGANGDASMYDLGLAIASKMDDATILSEVSKYVDLEYGDQRRRRHARQRKSAFATTTAAPVSFSLRLTDEEAMEDVAAVSLPNDVNPEAAPVPAPAPAVAVPRHRKRRRN